MGYWRDLAEAMSKYQVSEKQVLRIFYLWLLHISELHGIMSVCVWPDSRSKVCRGAKGPKCVRTPSKSKCRAQSMCAFRNVKPLKIKENRALGVLSPWKTLKLKNNKKKLARFHCPPFWWNEISGKRCFIYPTGFRVRKEEKGFSSLSEDFIPSHSVQESLASVTRDHQG